MSLFNTQSTNSKSIVCSSFIINKEKSTQQIEEHNISAFKNNYDKIKDYKKNEPNNDLIETVKNKVTLNIKKDIDNTNNDTNNNISIYSNVIISKKKYT